MIRKFRLKYGITQDAMAGLFGISRSYLAMLESGERAPTPEHQKIIQVLEKVYKDLEAGRGQHPTEEKEKFPEKLLQKKLVQLEKDLEVLELRFSKFQRKQKKKPGTVSPVHQPGPGITKYENYIYVLIKEAGEKGLKPVDHQQKLEMKLERVAIEAQLSLLKEFMRNN